jgi:hypothetical protein
VFAIAVMVSSAASAQIFKHISERLDGYQEDPLVVSTAGRGSFNARISNDGTKVAYELSYANTGTAVSQAHIHFGRQSQSGGIVVFLCTNLGNGPAGTQACPAAPATITGVIEADDVLAPGAPPSQGIAAGEFAEFLRALRAGATYVNVHTAGFPGGEIRANLDGFGLGLGHDH